MTDDVSPATLPEPFDAWLRSVASAVLVDGDDAPLGNMVTLSIDATRARATDPATVVDLVHRVARAYEAQVARRFPGVGFHFYAWHDEQAGQLRCSCVPGEDATCLPFRATLVLTDDPAVIARSWLGSPWLSGIPLAALTSVDDDDDDDERVPPPLDVWAVRIPR